MGSTIKKSRAHIACVCDKPDCDSCPKYKMVKPNRCFMGPWKKKVSLFVFMKRRKE